VLLDDPEMVFQEAGGTGVTPDRFMPELRAPQRLNRGLVIVLPGIEGYSHLNRRIVRGLVLGGVPHAIEIYDWTYGWFWQLWSLRSRRRHTEQATLLAGKIAAYQNEYPGRPVYLVGHSGGGSMLAYTLEALEPGRKITGGIMLVPALSPSYSLMVAVSRTEQGLWNFCSHGDILFLGAATLLCGTTDGRHAVAAGNLGFTSQVVTEAAHSETAVLRNVGYQWNMLSTGHWGGHLSISSSRFIARDVAPLIMNPASLE
jgi:alpha-beta hydrolase superfamily lysophospholipase